MTIKVTTALKQLFILLLICALHLSVVAQNTIPSSEQKPGKLWYGVKLNGNRTILGSNKSDSISGAFSMGGGFFAAFAVNKYFRPQLEVEYSTISFVKTTDERTNKNYLDLGLNFLITPGNRTTLQLMGGFQASICQGITNHVLSGSSISGTTKQYDKSETGRVDYQWTAGASIPASDKVDFFVKYHKTITGSTTPQQVKGKTDYLQFGITVNLNKFIEDNQLPSAEELEEVKDNRTLGEGGVLLVRLNYNLPLIKWYEENKRWAEADSVRRRNDAFNITLMQAFKKYYTFSKVYFFKDDKSYEVAGGSSEGIFVNDSLEIDSSQSILGKRFLIAEIGFVESFTGSTIDNMMVVLNSKFKQMKSPFPYSTNNLKAFQTYRRYLSDKKEEDFKNPLELQVYVLNKRIHAFYYNTFNQEYNPNK